MKAGQALGVLARLAQNTRSGLFGETRRAYADFFGPGGYRRPEDYARDVEALLGRHGDRLTRVTLPVRSVEGRLIEALRLQAPGVSDGAPRVLLTSLLHAREFVTGEVAMAALEALLEGSSPEAAALGRRAIIDVVPVVNPDGVAINMARLARSPYLGALHRGNSRGVDLNRNFGHAYRNAERAYRYRISDEFSGSGAFSEPESQALRDHVLASRPVAAISLHSYSSVILYPSFSEAGCDPLVESVARGLPEAQPHERYAVVQGSRFFKHFPGADQVFRVVRGTPWVHGTLDDWLGSVGTRSILIEIARPGPLPEHLAEIALSHLRAFNPPPADLGYHIENVLPLIFGFFHGVLDGLGYPR